mgnify:CR=1 FL=1
MMKFFKLLTFQGSYKFLILTTLSIVFGFLIVAQPVAAQGIQLLPSRDDFDRSVSYTSDHFVFGDRWFYVYGNKNKLGIKMENGYLDMTGYDASSGYDGWQLLILRDDNSSYDGNWWWPGYTSVPGDPDTPLTAMKVANLAPQANGRILNIEFKTLHTDLNGHFGFGLNFGNQQRVKDGLGFETHLISQWGTAIRWYSGGGYGDFWLPTFIDSPHTFRWEIDLTDPNYVSYKVYMDNILRYSRGGYFIPDREVIGFNLYQSAGFWGYPTSHSRWDFVHLWIDNEKFRFSDFSAKVEAELGSDIAENELEAKGNFTLGQGSNGIDPLTEKVTIKIGDFETTIPAGSFKWFEHPKKPEKSEWKFEGTIDGVPIEMKIKPTGSSDYEFKFEAEGLGLCWLTSPVEVNVSIGDDFGEIEVVPEVKGLENWGSTCPGVPIPPEIQTPGISPD